VAAIMNDKQYENPYNNLISTSFQSTLANAVVISAPHWII